VTVLAILVWVHIGERVDDGVDILLLNGGSTLLLMMVVRRCCGRGKSAKNAENIVNNAVIESEH